MIIAFYGLQIGLNKNEAKQEFKEICAFWFEYEKNYKKYYRSTAELNTKEMSECIYYFRAFVAKEVGTYIPEPNEHMQIESILNQLQAYTNKKYIG